MILEVFTPTVYKEGIGRVTSPPFDMITREMEHDLKQNPYNIVNLKECKDPEGARVLFKKWMDLGVLNQLSGQGYVVLKQVFKEENVTRERYGVIAIINMKDPENSLIPHEEVIPELVREREKLIERMEYQTEPVFVVSDRPGLNETLKGVMKEHDCDRTYEEPEGVINSICIITDQKKIEHIENAIKGSLGIIADGHHRTKAMIDLSRKYEGLVPFFNHLFVYVTSLSSDSIFISQVHRIIGYDSDLIDRIRERFQLVETQEVEQEQVPVLVLDGKRYLMKLRNGKGYEDNLKEIDSLIRMKKGKKDILYTYVKEEAEKEIKNHREKIAFLMPPWNKEEFINIVKHGRVLPAKSTYFYPKIPSGIAFYGSDAQECHCGLVGRAADS